MGRPGESPDRQEAVAERFFFIHVMKTGGGTLRLHIRNNFAPDQVFPQPDLDADLMTANTSLAYLRALPAERRRRIRVFTGHFPFMATELLGEVTTLTLLRDPVERTLSWLRARQRNHGGKLESIYEDPMLFEMFVHNHQAKLFSFTAADEPDSYLAGLDVTPDRLALAKRNLSHVDAIGVQEHFDDFCSELKRRFGWAFGEVENRHVSEPVEVPTSLRERIAADNGADMELYAFARELCMSRRRVPGAA
jgi:hypothetical protein